MPGCHFKSGPHAAAGDGSRSDGTATPWSTLVGRADMLGPTDNPHGNPVDWLKVPALGAMARCCPHGVGWTETGASQEPGEEETGVSADGQG